MKNIIFLSFILFLLIIIALMVRRIKNQEIIIKELKRGLKITNEEIRECAVRLNDQQKKEVFKGLRIGL